MTDTPSRTWRFARSMNCRIPLAIGLTAAALCGAALTGITAEEPQAAVSIAELTPRAEEAIEKGLEYIARTQQPDGSWGKHKIATTALSLMAFMVKGHFPDQPPYGAQMSKGIDFLLGESKKGNGYMGLSMYEHGLATLVLSEAWGMTDRDNLRDALKTAVGVILRSQNSLGGWRYQPAPTDADISATVMQVVALASAKEAGIMVPDAVIQKAIAYVKSCEEKGTGGFCYQPAGTAGVARTAAGVMSLMMCGQREDAVTLRGLNWLKKMDQNQFESADGFFFYAHYYAVQAMFQGGDEWYQKWYPRIRESVLAKQAADGSWPDGNEVGTQFAILILGVPYRYLPIYQR